MIMKREIYEMDLPHRAITIYMYLRDRADKQGRCFPSVHTIANDLKLSTRTVIRGIGDLEKSGVIKKENRFRFNGGKSSNMYYLL
ncbi:helix-turn-helix domain-containing protein [Diplocloster hominis]|uniref:helix-turn-helix domain-containing protein n=1 Tax=Diplocloster hominis TaxID=3079010 RepID=UPI0031BB1504